MRKVFLSILNGFAIDRKPGGVIYVGMHFETLYLLKYVCLPAYVQPLYIYKCHLTSQYSQNLQSRPTATSTTVRCDRLAISLGNIPVQARTM